MSTKQIQIPNSYREQLQAAALRCVGKSDQEKLQHRARIDQITDDLARQGYVHPRTLSRPEFSGPARPKQRVA